MAMKTEDLLILGGIALIGFWIYTATRKQPEQPKPTGLTTLLGAPMTGSLSTVEPTPEIVPFHDFITWFNRVTTDTSLRW